MFVYLLKQHLSKKKPTHKQLIQDNAVDLIALVLFIHLYIVTPVEQGVLLCIILKLLLKLKISLGVSKSHSLKEKMKTNKTRFLL